MTSSASRAAKHTPGPWEDVSDPTFASVRTQSSVLAIACNQSGADIDEDLANARLIAAAPEMLTALEHIAADLGLIASFASRVNDTVLLSECCELQAEATAAIRKAKGE